MVQHSLQHMQQSSQMLPHARLNHHSPFTQWRPGLTHQAQVPMQPQMHFQHQPSPQQQFARPWIEAGAPQLAHLNMSQQQYQPNNSWQPAPSAKPFPAPGHPRMQREPLLLRPPQGCSWAKCSAQRSLEGELIFRIRTEWNDDERVRSSRRPLFMQTVEAIKALPSGRAVFMPKPHNHWKIEGGDPAEAEVFANLARAGYSWDPAELFAAVGNEAQSKPPQFEKTSPPQLPIQMSQHTGGSVTQPFQQQATPQIQLQHSRQQSPTQRDQQFASLQSPHPQSQQVPRPQTPTSPSIFDPPVSGLSQQSEAGLKWKRSLRGAPAALPASSSGVSVVIEVNDVESGSQRQLNGSSPLDRGGANPSSQRSPDSTFRKKQRVEEATAPRVSTSSTSSSSSSNAATSTLQRGAISSSPDNAAVARTASEVNFHMNSQEWVLGSPGSQPEAVPASPPSASARVTPTGTPERRPGSVNRGNQIDPPGSQSSQAPANAKASRNQRQSASQQAVSQEPAAASSTARTPETETPAKAKAKTKPKSKASAVGQSSTSSAANASSQAAAKAAAPGLDPVFTPAVPAPKASSKECTICMDAEVDSAFIPCGHTICSRCGPLFIKKPCHICRGKVKKVLRMYLP